MLKQRVRDGTLRLLLGTDAASEGLNLQRLGTLIHIDLPWNPTRLEQREGRVDRFGQNAPTVRVLTVVGKHLVDRIVEEVLIKKHLQIRKTLGVSVPVPATRSSTVPIWALQGAPSSAGS